MITKQNVHKVEQKIKNIKLTEKKPFKQSNQIKKLKSKYS